MGVAGTVNEPGKVNHNNHTHTCTCIGIQEPTLTVCVLDAQHYVKPLTHTAGVAMWTALGTVPSTESTHNKC